jgi:hypothetical protein
MRNTLTKAEFGDQYRDGESDACQDGHSKTPIHSKERSSRAFVNFVISHMVAMIPTGFPRSARMTPPVTGSVKAERTPSPPPTATPAEKNANSGTAIPAETGRTRFSKIPARSGDVFGPPSVAERRTGMAKPSTTPAKAG